MEQINHNEESREVAAGYTYTCETFFETSLPHYDQQFTGIVGTHSNQLFYLAYQITKNKQVAEDIVQEAFLKLWQHRLKIIPGNPAGWLHKVVSNLGYKHIKRLSLQTQVLNSLRFEKKDCYSDVEEQLIKKEDDELLHHLFNSLPKKQQAVYHLSREEGLRRNEIASQLNLSPNTVKVHLMRAVQFMREHIACIILFVLFFVFNNLFFRKSNTVSRSRDLYKKEYNSERNQFKRTVRLDLSDRSGFEKIYYR